LLGSVEQETAYPLSTTPTCFGVFQQEAQWPAASNRSQMRGYRHSPRLTTPPGAIRGSAASSDCGPRATVLAGDHADAGLIRGGTYGGGHPILYRGKRHDLSRFDEGHGYGQRPELGQENPPGHCSLRQRRR
jgi:hypothetical protein